MKVVLPKFSDFSSGMKDDSHETRSINSVGLPAPANTPTIPIKDSLLSHKELEYLDSEEAHQLKQVERVLSQKEIVKHELRQKIESQKKSLEKVMNSNMSFEMKEKLMGSIRDTMLTQINCLMTMNEKAKDIISNLEKAGSPQNHKERVYKRKEMIRVSKNSSTTSTYVANSTLNSIDQRNNFENNGRNIQSFLSVPSVEDIPEEQRVLEEIKQENGNLEDVIASLKQTRNQLAVTIEITTDELMDYQDSMQRKKTLLMEQNKSIEEFKRKVSSKSVRQSTSIKKGRSAGNETERMERSSSFINTSMLQEVSSKVSGFMGKILKSRHMQTIGEKVLSNEFLRDLNLQTMPNTTRDTEGSPKPSRPVRSGSINSRNRK